MTFGVKSNLDKKLDLSCHLEFYSTGYDQTTEQWSKEKMMKYKPLEDGNDVVDPYMIVMKKENDGYRRLYGNDVRNRLIKTKKVALDLTQVYLMQPFIGVALAYFCYSASNSRAVRSEWIFKKKTNMEGKVQTFKERLVAKGYTQIQGIDYEDTFSPVAKIKSIRIFMAIAAYSDFEIWKMDVKTAFLNGYLEEDAYMEQPEGFVKPDNLKKV
ncbi:uncharacterized protein LOC111898476 [Lactuca sativa]|uniref:uncharacterized protein LOC111898476 n=1 Tax=Lactuca sativa TaxID=4236 RepID=UPI000CD916DF|nr:uncharacterized protein LOC111898476 [Lactuca sativa]